MQRYRSTLIYAIFVVGLLCFVFIDKKMPGTREREEADTQLFKLNPDDVTSVEITNVHGLFIFKKINNHWELKRPVNTPADGSVIDGIINQIAFAEPQRVIQVDGGSSDDQSHLKDWGLLPTPVDRVVIHTPIKQYELMVGRKTAINDSVYTRASGRKNEAVRIVPSTVKEGIEKDLSDFRSRSVFDFDAGRVTRIATRIADTPSGPGQAATPGQQCEVDLKDGKWTMQMPLVARASEADVQAVLAKIVGLKVVDFVADDAGNLSQYGLTSPTATLSVTLDNDEPMALQIGGPVPNKPDQVYAQRLKSNSVFTLTKVSLDDILKGVPNVRDQHVFPFDPNKATGLSYMFGPKKVQVRSDRALWTAVGDAEGPADVGKVTDTLARLSQLTTTPMLKDSVTDLKPYGLDKPVGRITVQSSEFKPAPTLTLFIGKAENKLLYVRNSSEPFIYTLPDTALDLLPASNLALRDGRAINLKREQVTNMTITVGSGSSVSLTRSPGGTWSASGLRGQMVNSIQADAQASLFCQLQAQTWLGPALPAYGLAKPVLTISVLADKPAPVVLHIGARLPDGTHAAQIQGDPTVFALSDGDYGILNASSLQLIPKELSATNAPTSSAPTNAAPALPATNPVK